MASSPDELFGWIERLLQNGDATAAFDHLIERFKREKQYPLVFEARLMQKRVELGLPLVSQPTLSELPADIQPRYQEGYVRAAREVGDLFLADGNIPRAWPYFRALGDLKPVVAALDTFDVVPETPESQELLNSTIQVAFQEEVHPRRGLELILKHYGMCRAITMFGAYPQKDGRAASLALLVRALHQEIVDNVKQSITAVEGSLPESNSIPALIRNREWLFANNRQHTDSSHLVGILRVAAELDDRDALRLAIELADYGTHLGELFQYVDDPPFERVYEDWRIYLRALAGEDVERAIAHFDAKAARSNPMRDGPRAGEVLVKLLCRLERYDDAMAAFRRHLTEVGPEDPSCPNLAQLCEMAGDFEQLKQVATERADPLTYIAGLIQSLDAEAQRKTHGPQRH
jgi:hypothetical protein